MRFLLLLLAALTFSSPQSWACLYISTKEESQKSVREHYKKYDYIVKARVLNLPEIKAPGDPIAEIEIIESFKGDISGNNFLYRKSWPTSCDVEFVVGKVLLLALDEEKAKLYPFDLIASLSLERVGEDFLRNLNHNDIITPFLFVVVVLSSGIMLFLGARKDRKTAADAES
jgi:hypothetical protein